MAQARRVGSTRSKTRAQILDATEQLMIERGYAAVSSRSVAAEVGIRAGLVHYYFPTLDDLFVAIIDRGAERNHERMAAALASPKPLMALWKLSSNHQGVALLAEIMAAANHRQQLRDQVSALAKSTRQMQLDAIDELLPQYQIDPERFPPELVAAAIQGVGLLVAREEVLTATRDTKAEAAIEALLESLEDVRAGKA
jgi:AcrR family transcriptional regulator